MKNFLIGTFCLYSAGCWVVSEEIKVTGYEGQKVTIKCSHRNAGSNLKYFCRRNKCTNKDILIKSEVRQRKPTKGRFSLYDDESGTFTVTITGLKKTDTGTYWCGIDRTLMDTHTEVQLTVLDAPTTIPQTLPTTAPSSTAPPLGTTVLNQGTQTTDQLIYIAVGVGLTTLVFGLLVAVCIKMRHRAQKSKEAVSYSTENPNMVPTDGGTKELVLEVDDKYQAMRPWPAADSVRNLRQGPNHLTSKDYKDDCVYQNFTPNAVQDDSVYENLSMNVIQKVASA